MSELVEFDDFLQMERDFQAPVLAQDHLDELLDPCGPRNLASLRDLRVFVDNFAESVTSDDLDIASFGPVQWS